MTRRRSLSAHRRGWSSAAFDQAVTDWELIRNFGTDLRTGQVNDDEFLAAFGVCPRVPSRIPTSGTAANICAWRGSVRRDGRSSEGGGSARARRRFAAAHGIVAPVSRALTGVLGTPRWRTQSEAFPELDRFRGVLGCYAGFEDRRLPIPSLASGDARRGRSARSGSSRISGRSVTRTLRPNGRETEETPWRIA